MTLHSHGICMFLMWCQEFDLELLQSFSLGHYHQEYFVFLYTVFVLPVFDYCDVVWCPTTAKFTSKIEKSTF